MLKNTGNMKMVISLNELEKKLRKKATKLEKELEKKIDSALERIDYKYVAVNHMIRPKDYNIYLEEIPGRIKRKYEDAGWKVSCAQLKPMAWDDGPKYNFFFCMEPRKKT